MRKVIGTIKCGCEICSSDVTSERIILYWVKNSGIFGKGHTGEEKIEQHYSHNSFEEAVNDCILWYNNPVWDLKLIPPRKIREQRCRRFLDTRTIRQG